MNASLFGQIARYGVTGVSSVAIYLALLGILIHFVPMPEVVANATSYAVATLLNYMLNFYWSFASAESHTSASAKFGVIVMAGVALNSAFVTLAVNSLDLPVMWAAGIFAVLWPIISFSAQKFWAFRA